MIKFKTHSMGFFVFSEVNLIVKIITGILLGVWLLLVLLGRGGFIHILLLVGISILVITLTKEYRRSLTA